MEGGDHQRDHDHHLLLHGVKRAVRAWSQRVHSTMSSCESLDITILQPTDGPGGRPIRSLMAPCRGHDHRGILYRPYRPMRGHHVLHVPRWTREEMRGMLTGDALDHESLDIRGYEGLLHPLLDGLMEVIIPLRCLPWS